MDFDFFFHFISFTLALRSICKGIRGVESLRSIIAGMTADLVCALILFIGNVGHLGVLSYKVLKFTELEVVKVCVHVCMVCVGVCVCVCVCVCV